jgi:hypothetical protein
MKRKILLFGAGIISILFLVGCTQMETDVQLARRIFNGLCSGNRSVQNLIDWENFQAMGVDVGKAYSSIVYEKERSDYRKMFFYNLAYTFKASGGRTKAFINWRIKAQDSRKCIIAADLAVGKVLLLTLSYNNGKRKLTAIEWQQGS